jgi:hypothetical protein
VIPHNIRHRRIARRCLFINPRDSEPSARGPCEFHGFCRSGGERKITVALRDTRIWRSLPATPDGRYFVVRGRLWRMADPRLADILRARPVKTLMAARRAVAAAKRSRDAGLEAAARMEVDRAKRLLGER